MDQIAEGDEYDCTDIPNTLLNLAGNITLFISDAEVIKDMLGAKNAQIDKTGLFDGMFRNFFGRSFVLGPTDELWRRKRKATAHAFYKDRLVHMLETERDIVLKIQANWIAQIDASKDGSVEIDLSKDVIKIFQKFLIMVIFGEDIDDQAINIQKYITTDGGFEPATMGLSDALEETNM